MESAACSSTGVRLRRLFYPALFVLLVVGAGLTVWTSSDAATPDASTPTGNTIPPGGTIPPPPLPGPNQGQVNVLHVAPFDADLVNTGVQICDAGGNVVSDYLYYQQETGYVTLPIGEYDWYIGLAGDNCQSMVLDIPEFNLGSGAQLLLVVFGDNANQPLDTTLFVVRSGEFVYRLPYVINR